jgi:hypothetical protein
LVARNSSKLSQFAEELRRQFGISATVIAADLAVPEAASRLFSQLQTDGTWKDLERGLHRWISTRTIDGRLLCVQSLCDFVFGSDCQ